MLNPATGLLNETLRAVGLEGLAQHWLTDVRWRCRSVIAVDTWRGVGYIMVILIAGLKAIPREYYEAATIDGASVAGVPARHAAPPAPVLLVTTVLNLLYGLKVFDIVFVLTNGGPGRATDTVYTAVFEDFSKGRYGIATALSTLLFLVMIVLGYLTIRGLRRDEDEACALAEQPRGTFNNLLAGGRRLISSPPSTSSSSTRSRPAPKRAPWARSCPHRPSGRTSRPSSTGKARSARSSTACSMRSGRRPCA